MYYQTDKKEVVNQFHFQDYCQHYKQYAISQLRIVHSDLHLVTYLDVGNFCDKSTDTTLHEVCS